jgi:glutamyl/glutaminyl-tRNA synthetase
MFTTRFNPSSNGSLHLGHLYTALVNEALAQSSGGRFIVRFDDSNPYHVNNLGPERMARVANEQRRDLLWLGFEPDSWIWQSVILVEVYEWLGKRIPLLRDEVPQDDVPLRVPELIGDDYTPLYPLTPTLTAEKVVMDWQAGVTLVVRGVDLLSEYSLYQYYCRRLDLPQPRHIYLPRLKWAHGDMSKTNGAQTINDLRYAGYTAAQVRDMVAKACLHYPPNGWTLQNLKGQPRL